MADPSYLDYEPVAADNQEGSASATRFPEGWSGVYVNNALANMGAALRRLGDTTPISPSQGSDTSRSVLGDMSLQDSDAVAVVGGTLATAVRGSIPVRTLIPWYGTLTQLNAELTQLLRGGWVPCDGRTVTNPHTGAAYTSPNLRGRLIGGAELLSSSPVLSGAASKTTTSSGTHTHTGTTSTTGSHGHASATGEPIGTVNVPTGGGSSLGLATNIHTHVVAVTPGGDHSHSFTTSSGGSHSHSVDVDPLAIRVILLIRAW